MQEWKSWVDMCMTMFLVGWTYRLHTHTYTNPPLTQTPPHTHTNTPSPHPPPPPPHTHTHHSQKLEGLCEALLLCDLELASSKMLCARLWKGTHYPVLETLRKALQDKPASTDGGIYVYRRQFVAVPSNTSLIDFFPCS